MSSYTVSSLNDPTLVNCYVNDDRTWTHLADKGFEQAIADDWGLQQGVTTYKGYLTSRPVAEGLNRDYTDIADLV